jgi:hypothetical protein
MAHLQPHRDSLEKLYMGNNAVQILTSFAGEDTQEFKAAQEEYAIAQQNAAIAASKEAEEGKEKSVPEPEMPEILRAPRPWTRLEELHLEHQRLPDDGPGLQLSVPSMQSLSFSLKILSLQGNRMTADDILPLSLLSRLQTLNLSQNLVDDLKLLCDLVAYLPELTALDMRQNPVNSGANAATVPQKKYRDKIIMHAAVLRVLDEKEITDNQRDYLHSLAQQKKARRASGGSGLHNQPPPLSDEEKKFAALHPPPMFPYAPKVLTLRAQFLGSGGNVLKGFELA